MKTGNRDDGEMYLRPSRPFGEAFGQQSDDVDRDPTPKVEVEASLPAFYRLGGLDCYGGGGVGSFRATEVRQWSVEVSGCTLEQFSIPRYWSGDSLTFTFGPQWVVHTATRFTPHAHLRFGGQKITEEQLNPLAEQKILSKIPPGADRSKYHDLYTQHWERTGFSIAVGGGFDLTLNRALAIRVVSLDYTRSWLEDLNGRNFDRGFRVSSVSC